MFISDIKASQVRLSYHQGKERYVVALSGNGDDFAQIELSPTALQSLVLQALANMPHLEPRYTVPDLAEAHRRPARILLEFDDRSIQLLLREVQSDTLLEFRKEIEADGENGACEIVCTRSRYNMFLVGLVEDYADRYPAVAYYEEEIAKLLDEIYKS